MALIRPLVGLVLVSALAAGCSSQSLFDNPGGGDGDGRPDAGDKAPPDGNAGTRPDAAVPDGCPARCLFDAVAQFEYVAGASTNTWFYAEELRSPFGTSYGEMRLETLTDGTRAYLSNGVGPAGIVHCLSHPGYVNCAGVEDKILFETAPIEGNYPALAWITSSLSRRRYRVSGDWRIPSNAQEGAPMNLLVVRTSRFDTVHEARFLTSKEPGAFDFEVDLPPSENLRLIVIPGDSSTVPVAVSFYISETTSPDRCQMMNPFEYPIGESEGFPDLCSSGSFTDQFATGQACPTAPCPATMDDATPGNIRGKARKFVEGASLQYQGPTNSYIGDWTVQFWAYLDSEGSWTTETLLADHDCGTERGIRVRRTSLGATSELNLDGYFEDPAFDRCLTGPATLTTSVTNDAWHFIRISRSTADETMSLCVDGVHAGSTAVPGDVDMSPTEPMWLGRAVTFEPAYFRGKLADLRVFEAALPCAEP